MPNRAAAPTVDTEPFRTEAFRCGCRRCWLDVRLEECEPESAPRVPWLHVAATALSALAVLFAAVAADLVLSG